MFGLFSSKPAPQGPAKFDAAIDVACSADTMFGMLDIADARYWKRGVGRVEKVAAGRFRLYLDLVPDHVFTLVVTEAEPGRLYSFSAQATPRSGRMVQMHERYEITPTGSESCRVRIVMEAQFENGMTMREHKQECETMWLSVSNVLAKLKVHAEMGAETVREIEDIQRAA